MSGDTDLLERNETDTKVNNREEKMWGVVLFNDNVSPGELLTEVVRDVFGLSMKEATEKVMLAHTTGHTVLGVYARDEAVRLAAEGRKQMSRFGTVFRTEEV